MSGLARIEQSTEKHLQTGQERVLSVVAEVFWQAMAVIRRSGPQ
jgi:hypothetical protein